MPTKVVRRPATVYWIEAPLSPDPGSYHCWAEIVLCDSGTLLIHSDYGEWAYNWSSHGRASLKHFLCEIHDEYLVRKLTHSRPKHFNVEKTLSEIRERIAEMAKPDSEETVQIRGTVHPFTEDVARAVEEALKLVEEDCSCTGSADLFLSAILGDSGLSWLYGRTHGELCIMEPDPQCVEFARILWPVFVAQLREEIAGAEWASVEDY